MWEIKKDPDKKERKELSSYETSKQVKKFKQSYHPLRKAETHKVSYNPVEKAGRNKKSYDPEKQLLSELYPNKTVTTATAIKARGHSRLLDSTSH